jgi:hypothetical protein
LQAQRNPTSYRPMVKPGEIVDAGMSAMPKKA